MDHYAPRKILQSSSDKPVLPQRCIALPYSCFSPVRMAMLGIRGRWLSASAALVDGGAPAYSTAQASDIISHVTLIFESSRYVDCIRSASASALQYSFLPSFLPSFSSRTSNYHPRAIPAALSLSLYQLRLPIQSIQTAVFVGAHIVLRYHLLRKLSRCNSLRRSTVLVLLSMV